jgi:hypothetical protein
MLDLNSISFWSDQVKDEPHWRPIIWLGIVLLVMICVLGMYKVRGNKNDKNVQVIDVENGGILDIYNAEHFGVSVEPRRYPFQKDQFFKIKAKKYVPFVIQIPGVPGECDFQGTTTTMQPAELIVARKFEALDRIKPPGKCTNREYFQIVATRTGNMKLEIKYHHRNGSTKYAFDVMVS